MEHHKSRWALIVFWDKTELLDLHQAEDRLAAQKKSWELEFSNRFDRMIQKYSMRPFWNPKMTPADQAAAMSEFQAQIYPIWKSIESKWTAALKNENVDHDFKADPEIQVVHRIDLGIWESGLRPNRDYSADPMEVRKKAALAEKYAKVAGSWEPE